MTIGFQVGLVVFSLSGNNSLCLDMQCMESLFYTRQDDYSRTTNKVDK